MIYCYNQYSMIRWLIKISRPRFWVYITGPFLIGVVAASPVQSWPLIILLGVYFTFPANLLIYGINDIFDYETDKHNPKKQAYETLVRPKEQKQLWRYIAITNAPFLLLLPLIGNNGRWAIVGFLFFGVFYSMPPIRAKVRPLLDSIFNVLYIFPGIVGYAVVSKTLPSLYICLAAAFWCMAMHAYSAVPDIEADRKAKIDTIATKLGKTGTLLFCLACYGLAAGLTISVLGQFSIAAAVLYGFMMIVTLRAKNAHSVMKLYSLFPYINMGVGMALFLWVLFVLK
jgi:lycopene elongase/hydratase (dihydrobisanhydrobacterioruberin-forming)